MAKYCSSESDVLEFQKQSLIEAVSDMKEHEKKRIERYVNAKNGPTKKQLAQRFDAERRVEEEKIHRLMKDLETLRMQAIEGTWKGVGVRPRGRPTPTPGSVKDRFLKCTYVDEIENQKEFMKRMDVLEMKHTQARNRQVFDPFAERKRLVLLNEKRDVLQKLVAINTHQLFDSGCSSSSQPSSRPHTRSYSSTSYSRASSSSRGTSSTGLASWAPFTKEQAVIRLPPRPERVPKLPI